MHYIYDRGDLSRLSFSQTREIVRKSKFQIQYWEDDPDQHYTLDARARVIANNIYSISPDDLSIKGSKVNLLKV